MTAEVSTYHLYFHCRCCIIATSTTQILSGIPNHAFYLFSVSLGADTHAYDVPAKVWYGTITSKEVKKNANFVQFATASVHVANSVYLNAHNLRR